ncbi:hypothetical protein F4703DRAFT_1789276 [Phycomyces blakesleeanus]
MFLLIKRYFVKRKKTKCDYNVKENFFIYLCEHKDIEIYSPKKYKCYLKQDNTQMYSVLAFYAFRAAPSPFFFIQESIQFSISCYPSSSSWFPFGGPWFPTRVFLRMFFFVFYAQLPFHCSHGEVLHVKFMYQCPVSSAVLLLSTSTFLNPTQLSASVQCPVPSCFLAQLLTTILLMVPSYHVWSTECVQSMLMERCTENQLSILHPSQLTARFCPLGHVKIVTERCKYKGVSPGCVEFFKFVEHLDVRSNFLLQASILGLADLLSLDNSCLKTYKYKDCSSRGRKKNIFLIATLSDNMLDSQSKEPYLIGVFTSFRCLTVEFSGSLRTIQ